MSRIKLIASITEVVNKVINYPIWVILLIIISYSTYFDNWTMPLSLYILFGISLSIPIGCSYLLHRGVNKVKYVTLEALNEKLLDVTKESIENGINNIQKAHIKYINVIIRNVKELRKGVFVPFFKQPFMQSIVYLLGIIAVILSQYYSSNY